MKEWISEARFTELTRPLIGLPISHVWRGAGSAIFFELGHLTETTHLRKNGTSRVAYAGEFGVMLEWSWRVERSRSVWFGSWCSSRRISNQLPKLRGLTLVDVSVDGRLPELVLRLSCQNWVHSFTTTQGQPKWCLFFNREGNERFWITSERGKLRLETSETRS